MPKIVDHDARRAEIARALWRVIAREGVEGASVRVVAAEAGCSLGAVRHYFTTQDELMAVATELMIAAVRDRVLTQLARPPGPSRAAALMAQLLPLDAQREVEVRVWLALLGRASRDPSLARLRLDAWHAERYLCRVAVCDLAGTTGPSEPAQLLDPPAESLAARLHTIVDGLTLQGATVPEVVGPAELEAALRAHLDDLAAVLRAGPAAAE